MFGSLLKAGVGVLVAPVALAVDVVEYAVYPFEKDGSTRLGRVLDDVGENIQKALDPKSKE